VRRAISRERGGVRPPRRFILFEDAIFKSGRALDVCDASLMTRQGGGEARGVE